MSANTLSQVTFRVQAVGGKFLADDIGGARILVRDAESGEVLADRVTQGDSGNLVAPPVSSGQVANASKNLIALADGSAYWWLIPDSNSAGLVFGMDLLAPRRVKVEAIGPVGGLSGIGRVESELWMIPGQVDPPGSPGHVIALPGLLVQPLSPPLHTLVNPGSQVGFSAKVTMMCGCQIASGGSWPADDFVVKADVYQITSQGLTPQKTVTMSFDTSAGALPSTFVTPAANRFQVPPTGNGTVYYQASIWAWQKGTGNSGSAIVNFYCTY